MRALTAEQEAAVARRSGSLLLAAGAGSGKTSVLAERFARAVLEDGVSPRAILAITFTERAAGELKRRVRERLLELGAREAAQEAEGAFVSTFHGFCTRLLRSHALLAGLDPGFAILDAPQARRLSSLAFRDALARLLEQEGDPAVELAATYGADALESMVSGVFAHLRSQGHGEPRLPEPRPRAGVPQSAQVLRESAAAAIAELLATLKGPPGNTHEQALAALEGARALSGDPASLERLKQLELPGGGSLAGPACVAYRTALERYRTACVDQSAAADCGLIDVLLSAFGARYEQLKRDRGALDFDDLELRARALLEEHEEVRRAWSERMELVMVDEFQDTNARQMAILRALERDNLFTVGDELQSIYGFRHADVEVFRARRRELAARGGELLLSGNFRGRPALIEAVNDTFQRRFGESFTRLVACREPDPATEGPSLELLLIDCEDSRREGPGAGGASPLWREAEARLLARRVCALVREEGIAAGEVAVLLRSGTDLPLYERALSERGLRTIAATGRFWSSAEVGDLSAYLRVLANPLDELALLSLLASPLVGLSSDALALLALAAREAPGGLWEALATDAGGLRAGLQARDRARLERFAELFPQERAAAPWRSLPALLRRAVLAAGYERHLLSLPSGRRRLANVHKLLRLAGAFEAREGRDLRAFLDHAADLAAARDGGEPEAPVADAGAAAVRLMTIHAAKGLEFPVVCLADLGRKPPGGGAPALLVEDERVGLRLPSLDGSARVAALAYEQLLAERRRREAAEEERILYVAMTRARERLLLSGAVSFAQWPPDSPTEAPIAWLAPALVPDLRERAAELLQSGAGPAGGWIAAGAGGSVRCWLSGAAGPPEPVRAEPREPHAGGAAHASAAADAADSRSPAPLARDAAAAQSPVARVGSAPERGGDPLAGMALSYSAVGELERCGYRFYLERVLRLPQAHSSARGEEERLDARVRGTVVHRLLEAVDFAARRPPVHSEVVAAAAELGAQITAAECDELAQLLAGALDAPLAQRLADARQVRREHPFALLLRPDGRLLSGVLDLIAQQPGGALVVDYKSDRIGEQEPLAVVEQEYALQRELYALAGLRSGADRVEVVHWFLERPAEPARAVFGAGEVGALEERICARISRAAARGFAVSEQPHAGLCDRCPGRGGLCSWEWRETSREQAATLGVSP